MKIEKLFMIFDSVSVGKRCVETTILSFKSELSDLSAIVILYGQKLIKSGSSFNISSAIVKLQNNITSFLGNAPLFLSWIASYHYSISKKFFFIEEKVVY